MKRVENKPTKNLIEWYRGYNFSSVCFFRDPINDSMDYISLKRVSHHGIKRTSTDHILVYFELTDEEVTAMVIPRII